jgi:hypothetical protein
MILALGFFCTNQIIDSKCQNVACQNKLAKNAKYCHCCGHAVKFLSSKDIDNHLNPFIINNEEITTCTFEINEDAFAITFDDENNKNSLPLTCEYAVSVHQINDQVDHLFEIEKFEEYYIEAKNKLNTLFNCVETDIFVIKV